MVEDASTWQHHRRRRRKTKSYPSAALLASLAAFIPPAVLARPVLLPFLYPSISQSTSTSSPSRPKPKRSPTPTASSSSASSSSSRQPSATSTVSGAVESRRADRIASNYQPDDTGHFKPACWSLHGQSNCPREEGITEPDVHEVVPGAQPDFPPTSTTTSSHSTSPPSPTTTSATSTTSTASPSATTVEPYTMTFEVSNIPPGWQKSGRTSYYSKNIIIGFSVTLAALICLTIVLCVIWRIRVARERRESERALKEKKRELGISSQTSDDRSSYQNDEDRESTRQRGLRRRRANVRVGDDDDDDDSNDGDDRHEEQAAMSERNGMTPTGRKRRTAFMRTFSGKMLTAQAKWRRKNKRRQQDQEMEEEEDEDGAEREATEEIMRERPVYSGRRSPSPPPLELRNSSPLVVQPPTSSAVEVPPVPLTPPPPPPASLQPAQATSPLRDNEDDEDPTAVQPPAYRRRNFGIRPRGRTSTNATTSMSPRALEKQREAEGDPVGDDVPEEYMYLAGMMPPPLARPLAAGETGVVVESRGVLSPPVEQDGDDDEEDDEAEEEGEGQEQARREDVTAHLATDDKTVLARLHQSSSAPSAPPVESSQPEATVPEEEDVYELEGSASGSGYPHPPPPPSQPNTETTFLPAPPAITSAHLFVPPPSTSHDDGSELPRYVAGPSAPSLTGVEKSSTGPSASSPDAAPGPSEPPVLPSAPPAAEGENANLAVVPSAPPMFEEGGDAQEFVLVPSAPSFEEGDESVEGASASAPRL